MGKEIFCINCGNKTIWQSDFDADDLDYGFEGIVSFHHCSNEKCNSMTEVIYNTSYDETYYKINKPQI